MKSVLFVIIDGLPDGEEQDTTMQTARVPNIQSFAKNGFSGILQNDIKDPDTGNSIFNMLGYNLSEYPGRGYVEALGINLTPKENELCLRANFATVDSKIKEKTMAQFSNALFVKDRRAGREKDGLLEMSNEMKEIDIEGMKVKFHKSMGHRGVVTILSTDSSINISDSDPKDVGLEVLEIKATQGDTKSVRTAAVLNKWTSEVHHFLQNHNANKIRKMPANYILLRGAGMYRYVEDFEKKFGMRGAVISGSPVVKGIGRALGMKVIEVEGATGESTTNLRDKALAALAALEKHNFVILHIKATDVASHDKNKAKKRGFYEKIDREVFERFAQYGDFTKTVLVVTSDHPTDPSIGKHVNGNMPFLMYTTGITPNRLKSFDEKECKNGPVIKLDELMENLTSVLG